VTAASKGKSMSRIPYPNPEKLSAEKCAVLSGKAPVLNISRMSMHASDDLWSAWRKFARTAAYEIALEPALRELLILRVAYLSGSDYEVYHHFQPALDAGASEAKCRSMQTGDFARLEPRERAMAQFVTELILQVSPSDATMGEARTHFSDGAIVETIFLVGAYMTMARLIGASGIQVEQAVD
jgi:alkylhydroperoxidase family enzyme